ncbi:MAG: bifunctional adenosylcobinamide kinase/adenosylcobinamide-phosphate guanylyltransferase [Clostridiales bacterium]|nr:bifunctional adenosylcobinamide kinase/adenosylcobinamide-phosphate guanylyltransferase [Clostridiales bacterium]
MHLILGGRRQGKLDYALGLSKTESVIANLGACDFDEILKADIICNLHEGVRRLLEEDIDPVEKFNQSLDLLSNKILIGDEIGSGIVPADSFERRWRDETGRVYVLLSENSDCVERVWAGCARKLKG